MASVPHTNHFLNTTEKAIHVAIIGGGIGGLCLALALLKHSHLDVQVYEAAPTFSEIGAGVTLGPNAGRALELIGPTAKQAMDKYTTGNQWASEANTFMTYKIGTGQREGTIFCAQKGYNGMQSLHRAHFLDGLVQGVPAQRSHFNKRLKDLEETEDGMTLHFIDGTTATADVVIGADGVHSAVRDFVTGAGAAPPVFTGGVIYRGLVPMDKAIEAVGPEHAQNATMICGPGKAMIGYPIDFGKTLNAAVVTFGHKEWPHEQWIMPTEHEKLAAAFNGWGKPAQDFVKLLDSPSLSAWALFDNASVPLFHKGRVAVIGDAAHACTPFQGQGAAQAIEDACVLSALLAKVSKPQQIPNALAAYDEVRRPHTQRVVQSSREAGILVSMLHPEVGEDMDKLGERLKTRMNWMWDQDLVAQNEAAAKLFEESLR